MRGDEGKNYSIDLEEMRGSSARSRRNESRVLDLEEMRVEC